LLKVETDAIVDYVFWGAKMNLIDSVEIYGFWGRKNVSIKFREDINFLIGPNGSGKTTILNIISAALRADILALYSLNFTKVIVRLKTIGANKKPIITVDKVIDQKMGSIELNYNVKEKSSELGHTYGMEGPFDERIYKDYRYPRTRRTVEAGARLGAILAELIEVNLLSINRTTREIERNVRREEGNENSIDQKVADISQAFSNYFSLLASKADVESKNFQEYVFLSLLDQRHSTKDIFSQARTGTEDRGTVVELLRGLGVNNATATKSVNAHFARVEKAKEKTSGQIGVTLDDAIALYSSVRVSEMMASWRNLQDKQRSIFTPRTKFEQIINQLFSSKTIHFDERNRPRIRISEAESLEIGALSSGEKQLFILLGEALLQEKRPVVFISDEPELSLHVKWQSSLFKNVVELNPACQIISATHSPDIVGAFQDRVIQIEECFVDA
jgi:predicted ATP-dependent endonuclease of OLD family